MSKAFGDSSGSTVGGNTEDNAFSATVMNTLLATAGHASPLMQMILFVHRILGSNFGSDPSAVLTLVLFLWAFCKIGSVLYDHAEGLIDKYFMCAMFVSEDDQIHSHLMKWLSNQPSIRNNQYLMAQTVWKSAWEEEDEIDVALLWTDGDGEGGEKKYLNFASHEARSNPRFIPAMGHTSFWHKGTYFRLNRRKESLVNTRGWGSAIKDVEEIKISCFGRSIEPIKQLLVDAKALFYLDDNQKTTIYRPRVKEQRNEHHMWQQVARRPSRPMSTVVLDLKEKQGVMEDVNEYLHPGTPRWYACRGIPLRRGYLFHGPPGTGKTSFSFALAGVFGIDIYVISLQDANITEEDLSTLFTKLPRRCIVLLEDIDTAGLRRDGNSEPESKGASDDQDEKGGKQDESLNETDGSVVSENRKGKRRGRSAEKDVAGRLSASVEGISLSGLLNAIDGVASHEGRVLIMTTNKPESLDEALIRPGRVDVQVSFTNATSSQATELFHRMYEASRPKQMPVAADLGSKAADELDVITKGGMREIAEEFGRRIPEGTFSPAEIQGFLLKRKKSPRKALEDVTSWVEASLKQKEANSRVSAVQ
ncbi:putative mitochondrial chaperone [Escovopsis weberi]|uniref:Putative mitochondrial chaperone n=1 Tax=Escovopsis weberi TaxID=150374 RepID=A0A0M9VS06_ESCWE|nr:putative mitochondrial chaperone [Escovopsis weberi]